MKNYEQKFHLNTVYFIHDMMKIAVRWNCVCDSLYM